MTDKYYIFRVEAWQYRPGNPPTGFVQNLIAANRLQPANDTYHFFSETQACQVNHGDWLVRDRTGGVNVMNNEMFNDLFVEETFN